MNELRITTVQADLVWENKVENLSKFDVLLRGIKRGETDVIVLPEMFTTGFSMNPKAFAETMDDATVFWLKKMAQELDAAITGSLICLENDKYYNRLVWMLPDGTFSTYDKRHSLHWRVKTSIMLRGSKGWSLSGAAGVFAP